MVSCEQKEQVSESGITYTYIVKGSGEKPAPGGYWGLNVAYFDHTGEKMFASADQGGPIVTTFLGNYPTNGSIEECFNYLGTGDSAVFKISADSLYKYTAGRTVPADMAGTLIEVQIGVDAVYSREDYMTMLEEKNAARVEEEAKLIEAYAAENDINYEISDEGLYYEIIEPGDGELAQPGQTVKVAYKGYVLDGTVFDTSIEEEAKAAGVYNPNRQYEPYGFTLVTGSVIQGWHIGVAKLAEGGKAKLIIPSRLAYGPQSRGPVIKPNSVLVFDVELVEIEE